MMPEDAKHTPVQGDAPGAQADISPAAQADAPVEEAAATTAEEQSQPGQAAGGRNGVLKYLLPVGLLFVAVAVVSFFFNPYAPIFVLASLLIQVPIVWLIVRYTLSSGYDNRNDARREKYEEDEDLDAFLGQEEREAAGYGFRFWPAGAQMSSRLNRAELMMKAGRTEEAKRLLAEIEPKRLSAGERKRLEEAKSQEDAKPLPNERGGE